MNCFVIMPFGNPQVDPEHARKWESIYSNWIKPAVEAVSLPNNPEEKINCHRSDKTFRPGEIIAHLMENLVSADIVIADLSDRNPNVFYELGVRHAVSNNCILIADKLEDVPFDLRQLRTIVYEYEPDSMLQLRDSLQQAIGEIVADPNVIDNPVRRFIYQRELKRASSEPKSQDNELVKTVLSEMASLRKEFSDQTNEVRQIMRLITSTSEQVGAGSAEREQDLTQFEGIWVDRFTESTFYVRLVNNQLFVPYTYGNNKELTGHVTRYRIIGQTIFARFEWMQSEVSGYLFLRLEQDGRMSGGWWYREDVPKEILEDISRVTDALPHMNKLLLERAAVSQHVLPAVEKYFRRSQ